MSDDFENELLGLAEDEPHHRSKKRHSGGGGRSHGYGEDSDEAEMEMDMDMDIDSDDDDAAPSGGAPRNENPYPLEGKYKNEEDRDWLEGLPEIDRESILATRQEEIQKYKESLQIAAMYKMAVDQDDDDDDSHPRKRQRKHTSVTTEASRAMAELKNRRKAKDERQQRRAARREERGRARSSSIVSDEAPSSEEGEISRDPWGARDTSPRRQVRDVKTEREDLDALPTGVADINSARLSRYDLVEMMYKDNFEEVITDAYVRIMTDDVDENGRRKYRIQRVAGLDHKSQHQKYNIEYKDRQVPDNRVLVCMYGAYERLFRIADVSNGSFDEAEFNRWSMTCKSDSSKIPKRSELRRKHEAIVALRDRPMTEEEVNREVESRKQGNQKQRTVIQVSSLYTSMQLALRRKDMDTAEALSRQIVELGGDPATGDMAVGEKQSEYDERIARINENNRQRTRVAMQRAHELSIARRKAEDAIVKAKQAKKAQPEVVVQPVSGLKRGETPQQYVARTFVLDLGDF